MSQIINIFEKVFKEYEYNVNMTKSSALAGINFALIKYWGKEDENLMIPSTSSIAFCLEDFFGIKIEVRKNFSSKKDVLIINNRMSEENSYEYIKFYNFLQHFKKVNKKLFGIKIKQEFFIVTTQSNVAIASGLASSAAFFAALTRAFFNFYNKLDNNDYEKKIHQSIIARTGSVSASRSVFECKSGEFIFLTKYKENSFSHPIKHYFNNLYCGIILIDENEKRIKSSEAMRISVKNKNYQNWLQKTNEDLNIIQNSIKTSNLKDFFEIIMRNSEMLSDLLYKDNISYDVPKTRMIKEQIKAEFKKNNLITFTQDAGPNLKVISNDKGLIEQLFRKEKVIFSKIL